MKMIQIFALVLAGVAGGVLFMKWQGQPSDQPAPPAAQTALAPVPEPVAQQPAQPEPLTQPAPVAQPAAQPERKAARAGKRSQDRAAAKQSSTSTRMPEAEPAVTSAPAPPAGSTQASAAPSQSSQPEIPAIFTNVPPPPPPPPRKVTVPGGTLIPVRTVETISSDRNHAGDTFTATLEEPLVVDGLVVAERGARVEGRVVDSAQAGRVRGVSSLSLELTQLTTSDGQRVALSTDPFAQQGETSRKSDAAKVGAAAGIGAAIGAIAGGGKGAGLGAVIGGAAGGGGVAATRGKATTIGSETRLSFRLKEPITITEKRRRE